MIYTDPLISIIIPVYKVEEYLSRCIDSILSQTYKQFEIILLDDDSPDDCPRICDDFANKYSNIFAVHLKNTGAGPADARNEGIKLAKGKYVMFIDSDDYVHSTLLEVLKNALVDNETPMAMCLYKKIYNTENEVEPIFDEKNAIVIDDSETMSLLLDDQALSACWGKLYDINLFDGITYPTGKCNEDMFTTPLVTKKAKRVAVVKSPLYYYCQDAPSLVRAKFSYPKLDVVDATLFWKKEVELFYPELSEKANIHHIATILNSCQYIANKTDDYGKSRYASFKENILSNYNYIINSKYTTRNNKIKVILMKYGMFRIAFRFIELLNIKKYDVGF
ncbi:MAG: glycosyltransferase [Mucilaginibacter sp.]